MKNIKNLKIFIIAGEVSGDVLGAKIMQEMPENIRFVGVGGQNMISAGLKTLFPMSDLSVMGVFEVLGHAKILAQRIKQTVAAIIKEKPDIVLTIDSPGFAKSVITKVKKSGVLKNTKFYHVVAPQVWAWGAKRAGKYAKVFDKLYAFFDFEKPYFEKYGLQTIAVGHPISDGLDKYKPSKNSQRIITFVPGSRISEVKKLLPVFHKTIDMLLAQGYKGYKFIIPTVETTDSYIHLFARNHILVVDIYVSVRQLCPVVVIACFGEHNPFLPDVHADAENGGDILTEKVLLFEGGTVGDVEIHLHAFELQLIT